MTFINCLIARSVAEVGEAFQSPITKTGLPAQLATVFFIIAADSS
jgi:hypothetical protein